MKKDVFSIIPIGMQKDISVNQFPNNMAFNIKNMRIVSTGNSNTTLCLVNEKGNVLDNITPTDLKSTIKGIVIGTQILNDVIILFVFIICPGLVLQFELYSESSLVTVTLIDDD